MISEKVSRGMTALKSRLTTSRRSRISTAVEAASASSLACALNSEDELQDLHMSRSASPHTAVDDIYPRKARRATVAIRRREKCPRSESVDEFQLPPPTAPYTIEEERTRLNLRARMRHDIFTSEDEAFEGATSAPSRRPVVASARR